MTTTLNARAWMPTTRPLALLIGALAVSLLFGGPGQTEQLKTLRIGTSGSLGAGNKAKETAALDILKEFITDETGLQNEIVRQKAWHQLAQKMASKELPIGVFQGYEFAWAQAEYPVLKPLVLTVKGERYPEVYIVVRKDSPIKDFTGLQGQPFALSAASNGLPDFYVQQLCQKQGKKSDAFFAKITRPENIEDAIDDVVDGNVTGTVVEKVGLEAYKRRKPGRFAHLKALVHSKPVLPGIIAYAEGALSKATLDKFRSGLLHASEKERGQTLLTMFRLTGFETPAADFDPMLKQTLTVFPPEDRAK